MTKTVIFAVSFTAIFVVAMIISPVFASGHLTINEAEVELDDDELEVEIETSANIPVDGLTKFGYAILTDGGSGTLDNVLVVVTHLPIDDSGFEDPVSGFHTHVLDLKTGAGLCATFPLEVDLAGSGANAAFDPDYDFEVDGNEIEIEDVPTSDLGSPSTIASAVAFTVTALPIGPSPTNLCVTPTSSVTPEVEDD